MSARVPQLGERESATREFKESTSVRTPKGRDRLVHSVVSFLNAEGGELWVGLREQAGRVAQYDPLASEDQRHVDALENAILDAIEPRVSLGEGGEVQITPVQDQSAGGRLLKVRVRPRAGRVYFVRRGNTREAPVRSGTTTRAMTYEEIAARMSHVDPEPERASQFLARHRTESKATAPSLHLSAALELDPNGKLDLAAMAVLLREPPPAVTLGNLGCIARHAPAPRRERGKLVHGELEGASPYKRIEVAEEGFLHFQTSLDALRSNRITFAQAGRVAEVLPQWADESLDEQVEEALLTALVVSFVRLVDAACLGHSEVRNVRIVSSLIHAGDWGLRLLNRPGLRAGRVGDPRLESEPLSRTVDQLHENPDRAAFECLRSLYAQRIQGEPRPLEPIDFPGFDARTRFHPPL